MQRRVQSLVNNKIDTSLATTGPKKTPVKTGREKEREPAVHTPALTSARDHLSSGMQVICTPDLGHWRAPLSSSPQNTPTGSTGREVGGRRSPTPGFGSWRLPKRLSGVLEVRGGGVEGRMWWRVRKRRVRGMLCAIIVLGTGFEGLRDELFSTYAR